MAIRNRFSELLPEITAWRRDIHENPELLFETHRTSQFVADRLAEFGCDEIVTGIGRTGVVALIKGRSDSQGKVVGLRADMDALPIEEATGLPYASKTPGVMHACGHDGHTAMLLGAAKYLAETRNFDGTVAVIFQPAEEGGGGGLEMCKDGMMERFGIDEVYGMHNWPGRPIGTFAIRPGPFFAATDTFEIVIEGKGGHAAKPNETVDSIVMAAQCVTALQTIAARNADPVEQIVVSVTSFESSSKAFNVIPQSVTLRGTVRTLIPEMRALGRDRIHEICTIPQPSLAAWRISPIPRATQPQSIMKLKPNSPPRPPRRSQGIAILRLWSWGVKTFPICLKNALAHIFLWATATAPACIIQNITSMTRPFRQDAPGGWKWLKPDLAPHNSPAQANHRTKICLGRKLWSRHINLISNSEKIVRIT